MVNLGWGNAGTALDERGCFQGWPKLKWDDLANRRRTSWHNWVARITSIFAMSKQTSSVLLGNQIVPLKDPTCVGNQPLFMIVGANVDNYLQSLLRRCEGFGDQALKLLSDQCADVTNVDKSFFHQFFINLKMFPILTATRFLNRFTVDRTQAERSNNSYTADELVDHCVSGMLGGLGRDAKGILCKLH